MLKDNIGVMGVSDGAAVQTPLWFVRYKAEERKGINFHLDFTLNDVTFQFTITDQEILALERNSSLHIFRLGLLHIDECV